GPPWSGSRARPGRRWTPTGREKGRSRLRAKPRAAGWSLLLARLLGVAEPLAEPLDLAGRVHQLHLAGEERVRRAGDVQPDQRVLLAVLPLDRLTGLDRGPGQEREVGGRVQEHDLAVLGVDVFLHGRL